MPSRASLSSPSIVSAIAAMDTETDESPFSQSELDSHANMVVVGSNSCIIEDTGKKADINPFSPDFDALTKVPIVHAGLLYECPHTGLLLTKMFLARKGIFLISANSDSMTGATFGIKAPSFLSTRKSWDVY